MFHNTFGSYKNVECGLVYIIHHSSDDDEDSLDDDYDDFHDKEPKIIPIPLLSVDIQADIVATVAQVQISQVYVNKEVNPIEAIYYFPVDSNGSVTAFTAELEGKIIQGIVKPTEEAQAQYEQALKEQKSAFLVESNKPDIFKVRVGFLKPGATVNINITYVTEVKNEEGCNGLRFFIPTTVSPRYIPSTTTDKKTKSLRKMTFSAESPAPLSIKVIVCLQGEIKSIESPSHKIKITSEGPIVGKKSWSSAVVNLEGKTTDMDRDFILNIIPKEIHAPRLYHEKLEDSTSTAFMTHLIPSFQLDEQKVECIFVLDRSGSMGGQSIDVAKIALQLFLRSLPTDCYFNVVGFGSSFQLLFDESVKYDNGSLKTALVHARSLEANLGGTEILRPLQAIYNRPYIHGYLRQIFVLTDGEVGNTEQVIGFIKVNAHQSRVFTLGIGDGASHDLVEGIANAGGGTAIFASYNESINSKVLQQLKNALQPSLTDVNIKWEGVEENAQLTPLVPKPAPVPINKEKTLLGYGKPILNPEPTSTTTTTPDVQPPSPKYIQVPEQIPPIHDGSQLLVLGLFPNPGQIPTGVTITAESPDGPLSIHVPLDVGDECEVSATGTGLLHKLAAIKSIAEIQLKITRLEYEYEHTVGRLRIIENEIEALKDTIIQLSCKHNIISNYTSFIAIDSSESQGQRDGSGNEPWIMQTRQVPSQFTRGYGGAASPKQQVTWRGRTKLTACKSTGKPPPRKGLATRACRSTFVPTPSVALKSTGCAPMKRFAPTYAKSRGVSKRPRLAPRWSAALRTRPGATESGKDDENGSEEDSSDSEEQEEDESAQVGLHAIIATQSFDGSFNLNEGFCSAIGLKLKDLRHNAKSHGWPESIYATGLALAYLQEKCAQFKEEWELIALKAKKWLGKHSAAAAAGDNNINIEALMKTQRAFINKTQT